MTEFPETRDSLLVQVRSPANCQAWDEFALTYRPVIYRLARRKGLQDADAQDLAQRVLIAVAAAIGRWEKMNESVRFRHWLGRVARNAILNALSRQPQDRAQLRNGQLVSPEQEQKAAAGWVGERRHVVQNRDHVSVYADGMLHLIRTSVQ